MCQQQFWQIECCHSSVFESIGGSIAPTGTGCAVACDAHLDLMFSVGALDYSSIIGMCGSFTKWHHFIRRADDPAWASIRGGCVQTSHEADRVCLSISCCHHASFVYQDNSPMLSDCLIVRDDIRPSRQWCCKCMLRLNSR